MSALPLDVSATSGDLGAFELSPWASSPAYLPPPPGAPPSMLASATAPRLAGPGQASVDASRSVAMPPVLGAVGMGDAGPSQDPASMVSPLPAEDGHSLGLSFLLLAIGSYAGVRSVGGLYGGVAGAVFGGATSNLVRAARMITRGTSQSDHEAIVSATYGIIGVGFGSYIVWKARHPERKAA